MSPAQSERKIYLENNIRVRSSSGFGPYDEREALFEYFALLEEISRDQFGPFTALIPGLEFPLMLRAHSSDVANLRQVFWNDEYGFDFPVPPRRILDLGAYCGFASVYLARRFPDADILAVEPSPANYRMLCKNTAFYDNIKCVNAAVWSHESRLQLKRLVDGHWGSIFGEAGTERQTDRTIPAYSVDGLMRMLGWKSVDFVKCDIEGAEVEVLSAPNARDWITTTTYLSVEPHDRFNPRSSSVIAAAMPPSLFDELTSGEFKVFVRRDHMAASRPALPPPPILLSARSTRQLHIERKICPPEWWGLMAVDDDSIQLHPQAPGLGRSLLDFVVELRGHHRFEATLSVHPECVADVIFSFGITDATGASSETTRRVAPGESQAWSVPIGSPSGRCAVTIATEMAPGARSNGMAWARWCSPRLE